MKRNKLWIICVFVFLIAGCLVLFDLRDSLRCAPANPQRLPFSVESQFLGESFNSCAYSSLRNCPTSCPAFFANWKEESMTTSTDNSIDITYYVISMMDNEDRIQNIKHQKQKIEADINIFEAVNGDNVDINNVEHQIVADEFKSDDKHRKREIGCYLSHYYILKLIEQSGNPDGYTVIFEDDVDIISNDFEPQLKKTLDAMSPHDFDILFIDSISNNNGGKSVVSGVCKLTLDKPMWGIQAYIVKNKNIDRLLSATWIIDDAVDKKYESAIRANKLTAYAFCPYLTKSIDTASTLW